MASKIKNRMASEQGFTLIELLVVIVILGILVAIAVPSYLAFRGNAQDAAAKSNVRSAIPAAEAFYQDSAGGNNSYLEGAVAGKPMTLADLQKEAPGVSPDITVVVSTKGQGYCLDDHKVSGHTFYYIGGSNDWTTNTGTNSQITSGDCATVVAG